MAVGRHVIENPPERSNGPGVPAGGPGGSTVSGARGPRDDHSGSSMDPTPHKGDKIKSPHPPLNSRRISH